MNTNTGEISTLESCRKNADYNPVEWIPVKSLTERQTVTNQVLAYEPCPCGSGKKFKFCCHQKASEVKDRIQADKASLV